MLRMRRFSNDSVLPAATPRSCVHPTIFSPGRHAAASRNIVLVLTPSAVTAQTPP